MKFIPHITLLKAYLNGTSTPNETVQIEHWLEEDPKNVIRLEEVLIDSSEVPTFDDDKILNSLLENSGSYVEKNCLPIKTKFAVLKVAASILIAAFITVISMHYYNSLVDHKDVIISSHSITPRNVLLPDGTTINLSPNSTVSYNENYNEENRDVFLNGQAYFKVAKGKIPFRVASGDLITTALGTEFNVKHYSNSTYTAVALVEGVVQVEKKSLFKNSSTILKPGQWIKYSESRNNTELLEGIDSQIRYLEKGLSFEGESLSTVLETVSNWYGKEFVLNDNFNGNCAIKGSFSTNNLNEVLTSLSFIVDIDYTYKAELIAISGGACKK